MSFPTASTSSAPADGQQQRDPETYSAQALTSPHSPSELKPFYEAFDRFYRNRLWFQLTRTIESFFAVPSSQPFRIDLYEQFIRDFGGKLDPLKHAAIAVSVARSYEDPRASIAFLDPLIPTFDKPETREAFVLATMERSHFRLRAGEYDAAKEARDQCEKILDHLDAVDLAVHASFYRVSGDYYKAKAEFADYYRNSLRYLACVDIEKDSTAAERIERAHDLGIAALLGQSIYNFGESLMHPILDALKGTEHDFIRSLSFAFNAGDISKFQTLIPEMNAKEPFLEQNLASSRQKICMMALLEAVFKRATQDRATLPFSVISKEAQVPIDEVEHVIMKASASNSIRGTIDQPASVASISWVQPRVLDRDQIAGLRDRLGDWSDKVTAMGEFVRSEGRELFVQ